MVACDMPARFRMGKTLSKKIAAEINQNYKPEPPPAHSLVPPGARKPKGHIVVDSATSTTFRGRRGRASELAVTRKILAK